MTPLQLAVHDAGGLIKTAELHALGIGRDDIAAAVRRVEIERVRQGWFADPALPPDQKQAARVGGQLACISAAKTLGLWETNARVAVHVCVPSDARDLRSPTSRTTRLRDSDRPAEVHWTGLDPRGTRTLVSVPGCVAQVAGCGAPELALQVAESALSRRLIRATDWRTVLSRLPNTRRLMLEAATGLSESGTETLFVHRIRRRGIAVRQQVVIAGVGRVDALIGERLIVELDSLRHHSDPTADRIRDAALSALGYRVLRFMYSQVVDDWPSVERAVLAAIARGDHLA